MAFDSSIPHHPLLSLPREDLDLITELVLRSGSLKDLASSYGVSYPTIRARLDRLIARLQDALAGRQPDPIADLLAKLVEQGELTPSGARAVRDLARTLKPERPAPIPARHGDPT
jgi:hypothetical protein